MAIELDDVASGYNRQKIDANFKKIEDELNNNVLNNRVGNNTLETDLDANSNRIINLAAPVNPKDAATREYVDSGFTESAQIYLDEVIDSVGTAATQAANASASASAALASEEAAETSAGAALVSEQAAEASAASIDVPTLLDRASHTGTQPMSTISDAGTAAVLDTGTAAGELPTNGDLYADSVGALTTGVAGQQVSVTGYHSGATVGGGAFVWNSAARHDGGRFIDPDRTFPTDFEDSTQVSAWYLDSGVDAGCWQRIIPDDRVFAEYYGATSNGLDMTYVIDAIIGKQSALKDPLYFGPGRFVFNGDVADNRDSDVLLIGSGAPNINEALTTLTGGTVFVGKLKLRGLNIGLKDLGVDHGAIEFPTTDNDAIVISNVTGSASYGQVFLDNVVGLSNEVEIPYHAILVEGYKDIQFGTITGVKSFFGVALKGQRINGDKIIAKSNGSDGVIIKADSTFGNVDQCNINSIVIDGDPLGGTGVGLRTSAFSADLSNVVIDQLSIRTTTYAVYVDSAEAASGFQKSVTINNLTCYDVANVLLAASGTGTGSISGLNINNVQAFDVSSRAFELTGNETEAVNLSNIRTNLLLSTTQVLDAIKVGANSRAVSISDVRVYRNGDPSNLAGVTWENSYDENVIDNSPLYWSGTGKPIEGYRSVAVTGTDQTMTINWDGSNKAFIRLVPAAGATVNTFTRTQASLERFPTGMRLTIVNDSANAVTLVHNPAGFIFNKGSANIILQSNEAQEYVFYTAVWHSV